MQEDEKIAIGKTVNKRGMNGMETYKGKHSEEQDRRWEGGEKRGKGDT